MWPGHDASPLSRDFGKQVARAFKRVPGLLATAGIFGTAGGNLSGALNEARASVAGDATTTPIWSAAGNAVAITGTPTITDFPDAPQAGAVRRIYPAAGAILTNNANIAVQGGANYTFAAGDWAVIEALTVSTFRATIFKADGTAVVASGTTPPVRQTVLSGPVDSNGFAAFGGSTGSTTVTASGTLVATAANGTSNRIGTIVNPSWTGLSTNGTMFLYLDIAADGTCTTGSTTLAPIYRQGGADVTTNNQNTFNIQEMQMKVGNGSTASQVWRVEVGRVTVSGSVVTAVVWYQLMGRYTSAWTATLAGASTQVNYNHNLGGEPRQFFLEIECTTNDTTPGYVVGDRLFGSAVTSNLSNYAYMPISVTSTSLAASFCVGTYPWTVGYKNGATYTPLTPANWRYRIFSAPRGW